MSEMPQKRVDESWKEQVEKEKQQVDAGKPASEPPLLAKGPVSPSPKSAEHAPEPEQGIPEARFDLFVSGLALDALIALGDVPHPVTKKQNQHLPHARYLIDLLGLLEEKTRGNLSVDEERLLKDALYQLRTRYLAKAGA